jgi:hypothetical protein
VAGLVLLASLSAVLGSCLPGPDVTYGARCTKPVAGTNRGSTVCALTEAQIRALPEANLVYPGSTLLTSHADAGALNVNGEPTAADVRSDFDTSAPPSVVRAWYEALLKSAGWVQFATTGYRYRRCPPVSTYLEYYGFDIYAGLSNGSSASPPPAGGTYYGTYLEVPSPAYLAGSPDASGQVRDTPLLSCGGGSPAVARDSAG